MIKIFKYWKAILFAIFILWGSLTSNAELDKVPFLGFPNSDKLIHFFLYFILAVLLLTSLRKNSNIKKLDQKIITAIFVISYGILMEVLQYYFTTYRTADIFDAIADTLGCLTGILIFPIYKSLFFYKYL